MDHEPSLFTPDSPNFLTISAGEPFLDCIAQKILEDTKDNPLALAEYEIFLPTRRAMRALAHSFIHLSENKISILPRIRAVGALDDDIASISEDNTFEDAQVPPAITALERRLILARLIAQKNSAFSGNENWVAALAAATELSKLLDSFYTEEIPFTALDAVKPDDLQLASHWEISRDFLTIVTNAWPDYLKANAYMDPVGRRISLIHLAADHWRNTPPKHPIIIAGTTGSTPAVASLMKLVASFPKGCVILPGLDLMLDKTAWSSIDDSHPQSGLKILLEKLNIERKNIRPWQSVITDHVQENSTAKARGALLRLALRPAKVTDDWLSQINEVPKTDFDASIKGLQFAELENEEQEATSIALLIRQALETPEKTVMLVSPDRDLTRRVASKLKRWEIDADDSGGIPFSNTPCGTFLRLVAQWMIEITNPVYLLAVLRHPLCTPDTGSLSASKAISYLDKSLRGLKPGSNFSIIRTQLENALTPEVVNDLAPFLSWLDSAIALIPNLKELAFTDCLQTHLEVAEYLTTKHNSLDATQKSMPLWNGEDGITGSTLMAALLEQAKLVTANIFEYAIVFDQLISGETVRRLRPAHPRVIILGPLEARLQHADHIILGGLNEGSWPSDAPADSFLSRPMRHTIKLPSPERRIGLSAHDFSQLVANPSITLTRSKRVGNAPSTPSRWVVRLRNILNSLDLLTQIDRSQTLSSWCQGLTAHTNDITIPPPKPRPPVEARPTEMFVTAIEKWLRDPYSIYGRYILRLRKLDGFNEEFDARYVGNIIHTIFEKHAKEFKVLDTQHTQLEAYKHLDTILNQEFEKLTLPPRLHTLWKPSFAKAINWFSEWHQQRLSEGYPAVLEDRGQWTFTTSAGDFTIRAKADRIDVLHPASGLTGCAVYDYKTGTLPTKQQLKIFNPQLALTGLIIHENGFHDINTKTVSRLALIKSLNRKTDNTDLPEKETIMLDGVDLEEALNQAKQSLNDLIEKFNDQQTPYLSQPRPEFEDDHSDYNHLARRAEWADEQDASEGGGNE